MPTINEVIQQMRLIKPTQFDDSTLVQWLSDVEASIYHENICWHEGCTTAVPPWPYNPETDMDVELMIPAPYSDVYIKYLMAQIDYHMGDSVRYINSMTMYNTALSAYVDWYNRTHMPKRVEIEM